MAKTVDQVRQEEFLKRQEEFLKRAQSLRLDLREQVMADKAKDFQTTINDAFTDAITYGTGAVKLEPKAPYKTQEQWLEETQNMRVVALNEACGVAKAMIDDGTGVTPEYIAKMALTFATFLTEGQA